MKLIIFAVLAFGAQAFSHNEALTQWSEFKVTYNKDYRSALENRIRFGIFQENLKIIEAHNKLFEQGLKSYKLGVNHFADLTHEEFADYLKKYPQPKKPTDKIFRSSLSSVADEVDWRKKGIVTPVKNQGECGSCWSFSATGSIEGQYALTSGKLVSLSEQNLVDCCDGSFGCGGGYMEAAFEYVRKNGIESEADYPYSAASGECLFDPAKSVTKISGYVEIKKEDEVDLQKAVSEAGPVSVAIDASYLQLYASGIYVSDECSADDLNHGVLVVGYGSENTADYWIVKNSWGESWGEVGYVRMGRNKNNMCGIASDASYPYI